MKKYITYTVLSLMSIGMLAIASVAQATTCGSVSMTADAGSTGTISCQAYGPDNIVLQGTGYNVTGSGITAGSLPTYDTVLANHTGQGTDGAFTLSGGDFSIDTAVWDDWDSIFATIKQGNDSAGGGWAMFEITVSVVDGTYITKLSGNQGTDISHYFVVGGTPEGGTGPSGGEVPIPAAVWLFGSSMLGLIGFTRRRKA